MRVERPMKRIVKCYVESAIGESLGNNKLITFMLKFPTYKKWISVTNNKKIYKNATKYTKFEYNMCYNKGHISSPPLDNVPTRRSYKKISELLGSGDENKLLLKLLPNLSHSRSTKI